MINRDFSGNNAILGAKATDVKVGAIPSENASGLENSDASAKVTVVGNELNRPKGFYHRNLIKLLELLSGKTQHQLAYDYFFYYFLTRSRWRAWWLTMRHVQTPNV